jgi:HSF-type DNA-binding
MMSDSNKCTVSHEAAGAKGKKMIAFKGMYSTITGTAHTFVIRNNLMDLITHTIFLEYVDYSTKSLDWIEDERHQQSLNMRRTSGTTKGSFPMKLYHMLDHLEAAGFAHIISFQPHGRALRIHLHQRFLNDLLPRYFPDINNIASFLRQLNIYGFRRMINNGPDRDSYFHAMFLRGRPDLCNLIERPLKSQYSKRRKYDPRTEPKFYSMPPIQIPPGCNNSSNTFPCSNASLQADELSISKHRSKPEPDLLQTDCECDRTEVPTFSKSATKNPDFNSYNCTMSPANHKEIGRPPSFLNDAECLQNPTSTQLLHGDNRDLGIKPTLSSEMNSGTKRYSSTSTTLSSAAKEPIGLFIAYATNYDGNNTVPADVVAAASSLLATPYDPQNLNDPSFCIIDQYCQNLAINILKQTCGQTQSLASMHQGES